MSPPATPILAEQSILESVRKAAVSHTQLQRLAGWAGPRPPPRSQHRDSSRLRLWPCLWGDESPFIFPCFSPASPVKS